MNHDPASPPPGLARRRFLKTATIASAAFASSGSMRLAALAPGQVGETDHGLTRSAAPGPLASAQAKSLSPRTTRKPGSTRPTLPMRKTSSSAVCWQMAASFSPHSVQRVCRYFSSWTC